MATNMNDLINYWKYRYETAKNGTDKDIHELRLKKGSILKMIYDLVKQANSYHEEELKQIHHYWWLYKSAKRLQKKYKVINLDKSKKTKDIWLKCFQKKKCKLHSNVFLYPSKDEIISFLLSIDSNDVNILNVVKKINDTYK